MPEGKWTVDRGLYDKWTVDVYSVGSKRFLQYNEDMQIPFVRGAMVPYGENSLLYVGGKHTTDINRGSDEIYQFEGKEMRAKVFRHAQWFGIRYPSSSQVSRRCAACKHSKQ